MSCNEKVSLIKYKVLLNKNGCKSTIKSSFDNFEKRHYSYFCWKLSKQTLFLFLFKIDGNINTVQ